MNIPATAGEVFATGPAGRGRPGLSVRERRTARGSRYGHRLASGAGRQGPKRGEVHVVSDQADRCVGVEEVAAVGMRGKNPLGLLVGRFGPLERMWHVVWQFAGR